MPRSLAVFTKTVWESGSSSQISVGSQKKSKDGIVPVSVDSSVKVALKGSRHGLMGAGGSKVRWILFCDREKNTCACQ